MSKFLGESKHAKKWRFVWRNGSGSHTDYGLLLAGLQLVIGFSWSFLTDILTCAAFFIVRLFHSAPSPWTGLQNTLFWCLCSYIIQQGFSKHYKRVPIHQKLSPLYGCKVINTFAVNGSYTIQVCLYRPMEHWTLYLYIPYSGKVWRIWWIVHDAPN